MKFIFDPYEVVKLPLRVNVLLSASKTMLLPSPLLDHSYSLSRATVMFSLYLRRGTLILTVLPSDGTSCERNKTADKTAEPSSSSSTSTSLFSK